MEDRGARALYKRSSPSNNFFWLRQYERHAHRFSLKTSYRWFQVIHLLPFCSEDKVWNEFKFINLFFWQKQFYIGNWTIGEYIIIFIFEINCRKIDITNELEMWHQLQLWKFSFFRRGVGTFSRILLEWVYYIFLKKW
jgi:hypothetical protein